MKKSSRISPKIILSGGGTGGHIYPAIAIANEIKFRFPMADILFVGAKDKMEMQKVPKAGFPIKGLWISGFQRKSLYKNVTLPFKIISSLWNSNKIINSFQPDIVIGTGGFASAPVMYSAAGKNIPILIQEQNSFPGITNKLLKNKAFAICTAYDQMDKFFPADVIHQTGNPIRPDLFNNLTDQKTAKEKFGLNSIKPVILSVGGSLGSRTLNRAWTNNLDFLNRSEVQLIWQTGQLEWEKIKSNPALKSDKIHITEFIYNMNEAYAAADIIVSRAGAMAISELTLIGKPTILVPFPYAADDHQTKNAQNLVDHHAAILIKDTDAPENLIDAAVDLIKNTNLQAELSRNIKKLARPEATQEIVNLIENKLFER